MNVLLLLTMKRFVKKIMQTKYTFTQCLEGRNLHDDNYFIEFEYKMF